jgi:hypothetical protein
MDEKQKNAIELAWTICSAILDSDEPILRSLTLEQLSKIREIALNEIINYSNN